MGRVTIAAGLLFLTLASQPCLGQENMPVDLTGTWRWIAHEDWHERVMGPEPGRYWGIPLNDAARMRADTYAEDWIYTSSLLQCRPRGPTFQPLGLDPMQIEKVVDPLSRQVVAYRISYEKTGGNTMVWVDGRPRPPDAALHTWDGFSTGTFKGDMLEITTTHLKESYVARDGVPSSFRATVVSQVYLEEPYLHWTFSVIDPDYLTEPLVRSATYIRAPTLRIPPYPCQAVPPQAKGEKYTVPHYLVGENPYLTEPALKFKVPVEGVRGGADTLYPEWRAVGSKLAPPQKQFVYKPTYTDDSTRIAERSDAQPRTQPTYDTLQALHVAGNVHLITGAGGNIAASLGGDGAFLVDSGAAAAADKVMAIVRQLTQTSIPRELPASASPFASAWMATHTFGEAPIRMIINTNPSPDHVGGNVAIRKSPMFKSVGDPIGDGANLQVFAHENVQRRLTEENSDELLIPSDAYFTEKYTMYRFFNNEAVQLFHMPDAVTDGDTVVWFRHSDVIAAGDIYNSEMYPPIDVDKGGTINGTIDALIKLVDMCVTDYMSQGGTLVIPGHGRIGDAADVGYYRDMLIVVRDRIQNMIDKKMTLEQVKTAKPTMDYDPLYGRQAGVAARFVEAVYRSLQTTRAQQ
jgi:glyoxylase-like metal-dependent hydrolase (beta-lactamase superfamily II)